MSWLPALYRNGLQPPDSVFAIIAPAFAPYLGFVCTRRKSDNQNAENEMSIDASNILLFKGKMPLDLSNRRPSLRTDLCNTFWAESCCNVLPLIYLLLSKTCSKPDEKIFQSHDLTGPVFCNLVSYVEG